MVAVILPHIEMQLDMTLQQKYDISARLRSEVVNSAMRNLDLHSLHALMILVIRDYGDGRIAEAWNLMGVCCGSILFRKLELMHDRCVKDNVCN